jgi:hypothetical protein
MPQLVPSGARSRNETAAESANKKKPRASEGSARRGAGGRAWAGGENISAPDKRTCDGRIVLQAGRFEPLLPTNQKWLTGC